MKRNLLPIITLALATISLATGCAKEPPLREAGFISDYSNLQIVSETRMNWSSEQIRTYDKFIVDPLVIMVDPGKLTPEEQADVATYFQSKLVGVLQGAGKTVVDKPGPKTARIRVALTGIASSTWWQKLHPVSRAIGAGTGGASMEAEAVDSLTGKQLGANVQASPGNQFDLTNFSTAADVKSAIDKWAHQLAERLESWKKQ